MIESQVGFSQQDEAAMFIANNLIQTPIMQEHASPPITNIIVEQ